ncbi:leucine-rich_repeat domain-containing protein [Hexamita inflata]|uniref:Leucine-rich repeat domain-containing protein n=1 Tax=Hexamita inflata TaxID=28002 RepID=A0AA86TZW6_9EUKA|nr:leucine-rich repeat domain-containing protein [Hexamita inflata]
MIQNIQNQDYDEQMTSKFEGKIKDYNLEIGNSEREDPDIKNLRFIEQLNISRLKIYSNNPAAIKLQSKTIKELTLKLPVFRSGQDQALNLNVNDLELENIEALFLDGNRLENNQLYNIDKFKKLHTLNVSYNNVDLTHIHNVANLTQLYMQGCDLKNIDQISSLGNLQDLDLSENTQIDISPLYKVDSLDLDVSNCNLKQIVQISSLVNLKDLNIGQNDIMDMSPLIKIKNLTKLCMCECGLLNIDNIQQLVKLEDLDLRSNRNIILTPLYNFKSLTKLSIQDCNLKQIDGIGTLTKLEVLDISFNQLQNIDAIGLLTNLKELDASFNNKIDLTPLKNLIGLQKLFLICCGLTQLSALKPLIYLQFLFLHQNQNVDIIEIQHLKSLTHLNLMNCNLVSICALRPLENLKQLYIAFNKIVYLDAHLNGFKKLEQLSVNSNRINTSLLNHRILNNIKQENFDISHQTEPSMNELCEANKIKRMEDPIIQLKEIQNKRNTFKTTLNNLEQKIKALNSNANSNHIQFTSSVVQLFQSNQAVSQ